MAKEVRISLTPAQKAKIKAATGKNMGEIRVSSLGKNLAVAPGQRSSVEAQTPLSAEVNDQTPLSAEVNDQTPLSAEVNDQTPLSAEVNDQTPLSAEVDDQTPLMTGD